MNGTEQVDFSTPPAEFLSPGLRRYQPLRCLGRGGGGEVWAVQDRASGATLALKLLPPSASKAETLALLEELTALLGLEGLGVPQVRRFGRLSSGGRPYLLRDLVEGECLASLLEQGRTLDALRAFVRGLPLLTQVHRARRIHGDLKPTNFIVGPDLSAVVVDFGLSVPWKMSGNARGLTPGYAAPELLRGEPPSVLSDIFALGVTLREILREPHPPGPLSLSGEGEEQAETSPPGPLSLAGEGEQERKGEGEQRGALSGGLSPLVGTSRKVTKTKKSPHDPAFFAPSPARERGPGGEVSPSPALRSPSPDRERGLGGEVLLSLLRIADKAAAPSPKERFPSVGELGAALRTILRLPDPGEVPGGAVWPVLGVSSLVESLMRRVASLEPGQILELRGRSGSGRSTILRRLAWSVAAEGTDIAWLEARSPLVERSAQWEIAKDKLIFVDDAGELGGDCLALLREARQQGARVVLSSGGGNAWLLGASSRVEIPPLDLENCTALLRRINPGLPSSVARWLWEQTEGRPGKLRALAGRLVGQTIVHVADVERLLTPDDIRRKGIVRSDEINPEKLARARAFRKRPTSAEAEAWELLRERRCCGLKFRRQQVIDGLIVDFYCAELRLALELDGPVHDTRREYDEVRDAILSREGIRVVRLRNEDLSPVSLEELLSPWVGEETSPPSPLSLSGEGEWRAGEGETSPPSPLSLAGEGEWRAGEGEGVFPGKEGVEVPPASPLASPPLLPGRGGPGGEAHPLPLPLSSPSPARERGPGGEVLLQAISALDRGRLPEARAALRLAGDSPESLWLRLRLAIAEGDRAGAESLLPRVHPESPLDFRKKSLFEGRLALLSGAYEKAQRLARESLLRGSAPAPSPSPSPSPSPPTTHSPTHSPSPARERGPGGEVSPSPALRSPSPDRERGLGGEVPQDEVGAESLACLGVAASFLGNHEEAYHTLIRALLLARKLEKKRLEVLALSSLGFAHQRSGRREEARSAYEEALEGAFELGDAAAAATLQLNLASLLEEEEPAGVIRYLEAALDLGQKAGRMATVRQALLNLANLDVFLGRLITAQERVGQLKEQLGELTEAQRAQLWGLEASLAARGGDAARASELFEQSAQSYEALGRREDAAEARGEAALVQVRLGLPLPAGESTGIAGQMARALAAQKQGDSRQAERLLQEVLERASPGARGWRWRALVVRGQMALEAGRTLAARRDGEDALAQLEDTAASLPEDLQPVFWSDPERQAAQSLAAAGPPKTQPAGPAEDRLGRILEINRELAALRDLNPLLERVLEHAAGLLEAERGCVLLLGLPGELVLRASRGIGADEERRAFSRSIAERVIASGEAIVTRSAQEDEQLRGYASVHLLNLRSVACVPVRSPRGGCIGALYLETRSRHGVFFEREQAILRAFSDQVAIAIENARLLEENRLRTEALSVANQELEAARNRLRELLEQKQAQLESTRKNLKDTRAVLRGHFGYQNLVGTSAPMRRLYALVERVKGTDVPLLITGESGTGKEVVARSIHEASPRARQPFTGVNCGAIPEHLLESELFGHVKGAFTGAERDRRGLFRETEGGSLLLDEIGEMPTKMQAGLLRVLQERKVRPVGGNREENIDVRVLAATHRDLAALVESGTFREDLLYRLRVVEIHIPPLRERAEDIPLLVDHFLQIFAARYRRDKGSVSRDAMRLLMEFDWPGNVRQLQNVLLNAWVLSEQDELSPEDFDIAPVRWTQASVARSEPPAPRPANLTEHRSSEKERILHALQECGWNRVKAAQSLNIPRRTFYRRLREYGIQ